MDEKNRVVLRVYLDQKDWVALARCRVGLEPEASTLGDLLALAEEGVRTRRVSFVLSAAHYFETHRRGDPDSRADLAWTMIRLSQLHGIAPPHVIVPAEVDAALDGTPMKVQLFGVGAGHALLGGPLDLPEVVLPAGVEVPPGWRTQIAHERDQLIEYALLVNPPIEGADVAGVMKAVEQLAAADRKFAAGQATLAAQIDTYKLRHRLGDVMTATEIVDIIDPLLRALLVRGIDPSDFIDGRERLEALMQELPSRWVTRELRRCRHENPQKRWEPHDLNDITALAVAVPYCDVVVTERLWAHHLNRSGVAARYGTTVLSNLAQLTDVIVGASAL